jgi:hypothetical protein
MIWRERWERWDAKDTGAKVETKNRVIKRKTHAQCSTKRAQGYDGEVKR